MGYRELCQIYQIVQIDHQIDDDLDHLAPRVLLRQVVQDLICIVQNPTQETCTIYLDHVDYTCPTGQHELNHARSGTDLPCLEDLHHDVGIHDLSHDLSEVCRNVTQRCTTHFDGSTTSSVAIIHVLPVNRDWHLRRVKVIRKRGVVYDQEEAVACTGW